MNADEVREKLHKMRGALSVIGGFLQNCDPRNDDEREHLEVTRRSYEKLCSAVEDLEKLTSTSDVDSK